MDAIDEYIIKMAPYLIVNEIAEDLEVSFPTVVKRCAQLGIVPIKKTERLRKYLEEMTPHKTLKQLAARLDIAESHLRGLYKKYNLQEMCASAAPQEVSPTVKKFCEAHGLPQEGMTDEKLALYTMRWGHLDWVNGELERVKQPHAPGVYTQTSSPADAVRGIKTTGGHIQIG